MKKNILVTGGLGFIGFNFIKYITENNLPYNITNVDCRTYAAKYCIKEKLSYFADHYIDDRNLDIWVMEDIEEILIEKKIRVTIDYTIQEYLEGDCPFLFQQFIRIIPEGV
jgi:dTDP-glucose 4,6-dehydratase